jgi:hypothetical protein
MIDEEYLLYFLLESQIGPKSSSYLGNVFMYPNDKKQVVEISVIENVCV